MRKVLVTGSEGFIGKHLVKRLESLDNEVDVIDLKIGTDILNIQELLNDTYDCVYHLAANADVRGGVDNPDIDIADNILGTHEVLEYMRLHNCDNIIFTSSATVYGERDDIPTPECAGNITPISLYGASKLAAENLIHAYGHTFGIKSWIYRFNNIIGKGNTHGVIKDFVDKLNQDPYELEILGNGKQTKQYLNVKDCINALFNVPEGIYNLSHDESIKVVNLADIVCDEMGLSPKYRFTGGDRGWMGDVPITVLDNTKIKGFGWKPTVSLEESIRETVRYLNER